MNYIIEISAFYNWLDTNSISPSANLLWHALMHICNKTGWQTSFTVAMSVLEVKTGLTKCTLNRARAELVKFGRISYTSRSGRQCAIYKINSFAYNNYTQSDIQPDAQNDALQDAQPAYINKQNETKLNNYNNHLSQKKVNEWLKIFNQDVIDKAVEITQMSGEGKNNARYTEGILKNWKKSELLTLAAIEANEQKCNEMKPAPKPKKLGFNNFEAHKRDWDEIMRKEQQRIEQMLNSCD